jgi:rare lipoprotein A
MEPGKIHASRAKWMIEMKRRPPSFKGLSGLTGLAAITFSIILSGCATSRPPGPTPQPESKAETKPEPKPETKPEAKPETKPGTELGARPELKPKPGPGGGQTGEASWYGEPHHGRTTASGETYDMSQLTAAHRTLPLGTRVLVTNLKNGRAVEVRINDRGPSVEGRIIDLSYAAARELGAVSGGTIPVRLRVISQPTQ